MSKREREETDVDGALQELEKAVSADVDAKIKALQNLETLVDAADEGYVVQRAAADGGALELLMALLEDESDAVRVAAASALKALSAHSAPATARLSVGGSIGIAQTPEKIALNPVADQVAELEGVFNLLTNMRLSDDPELAAAGGGALDALTALNRSASTGLVRELVRRLVAREPKALEVLEAALAGLDGRDEAAVLLDTALPPALSFLVGGQPGERVDAATLLSSICEKRRGAGRWLAAEGAAPALAELLVSGDLAASDAAARALWLLARDDKRLLSPAKGALGRPGTDLVEPLLRLVEAREDQEAAEEAEAAGDEEDDSDDEGGGAKVAPPSDAGALAVDNGDDALLLLRALAGQDDDVREKLKGQSEILGTRCSIM